MQITTNRLILRDLTLDDVEQMYQLSQDSEVIKYMDYIQFKTRQDAEKWVKEHVHYNNQTVRRSYSFAILLKDSQEFIGWGGIGDADDKTIGDVDFGYALDQKYWGKGYATEALIEIIKIGFEKLGAKKIFGQCNVHNHASKAVMEKVGMKLETTFMDGKEESVRYSIIK